MNELRDDRCEGVLTVLESLNSIGKENAASDKTDEDDVACPWSLMRYFSIRGRGRRAGLLNRQFS